MQYQSTRDSSVSVSAAQAISQGISKDKGLFVPKSIPDISAELDALCKLDYIGRAKKVLGHFLTDFTEEELSACVEGAYLGKFDEDEVAPLSKVGEDAYLLELWHGPTCAFKDVALQLLPYLLTTSAKKVVDGKKIVILVATSGDTGKAALEGFKDVENTSILVFYPEDGVSPMQKLQMTTQEGGNVSVCAIEGNFDDAQNGVKSIFTDPALAKKLSENGMMFSSANSINWGRLVPQIVYYVSAYCDLVADGEIKAGEKINVVVPTGNFGNILAAYYAREMGVPIARLICASNQNNVLTDFIRTGTYDRNRDFHTSISPSMDILISSNLERLLYHLCDNDDKVLSQWMTSLTEQGRYTVDEKVKERLQSVFWGGYCDDAATKETIWEVFAKYSYLCDTHTAVAVNVYGQYVAKTGDHTKTVIASTASPFKFSGSVLDAIDPKAVDADDFVTAGRLSEISGCPIPRALRELKEKQPRFAGRCTRDTMEQVVLGMLGM
ncbi:threonine synthase [Zongyangia hominis]|uniref:Threonine synthase n=1 Tax=Zongyangia hominis TaxID=2763677 RepID=A0A926E988_9FIRM|nr:threonine synthase [Zongyangia hominis]MBC8569548.1 threonine synthase [Zongyangia hominis]